VLTDAELASELRRRGLERVKRFTWQRAAAETVDVWRRAAGTT
jgi:glycosyltransferase involved in cell wall biosynthesis